jgi:thiamine-phosphate pyrophosphorylase
VNTGLALREITRDAGVFFIVNDRVDVAQIVGADGVHLGQDDIPAGEARKILGPEKIVGVSVETAEEAKAAERAGATYVGTGPVFATFTKTDAGRPYGVDLIRLIKTATTLPVVAVGGINANNVARVVHAGADGVAVVSAVMSAEDIAGAVRELIRRFDEARNQPGSHNDSSGEEEGVRP